MTDLLRATKIICTLGPATESNEMIGKLIDAGTNVFRLNMSHGKHDWAREVAFRIRHTAAEKMANVAILFDLQGPSIRTGELEESYELVEGDKIEFRLRSAESSIDYSTTINYDGLIEDVSVQDTIVVDNGALLMKVEEKQADRIICSVVAGGTFGSRRHINLPGVILRLPPLTEKDLLDLEIAIECEADYVAMSFVRDAEHVAELRRHIFDLGGSCQIVAKIEDQQAVRHIDDIILAADVIMVARGDLGIEVNVEEMPIIQRRIVKHCHRLGRRVIIATHMMESMITQPTPTRAEVTDVSNAVYEQADAVMLSGETSVGMYPIRCVDSLDRITRRTEMTGGLNLAADALMTSDRQRTVKAAIQLADSVENSRLVVFTRRGITAVQAAVLRPDKTHIFAFSNDPKVVRMLALARGVTAHESPFLRDPIRMIEAALDILRKKNLLYPGQPVIVVSDSLQGDLLADSILFVHA